MRLDWFTLKPRIDAKRWQKTDSFLAVQQRQARWWRDASLAYLMSLNKLTLPDGSPPPPAIAFRTFARSASFPINALEVTGC